MTGNVALDVVIGLVFVYLLYSLYATILMELISSMFELRAKNLKYTLKRMLADEKKYDWLLQKWLAGIATTFLRSVGFSANIKNKELYDSFMSQPNIKYLGSGGFGGRPSYLSAENYSKALIDSIKIDDPEFNLMATVEIGLESKLKEVPETRKHIESLIKDANNDPIKFKILLENWFNDTMERSTGWFKQTTQIVIVLIGLVLVISFNVDSLAIIKKLSTDKDARDQMIKLATEFNAKSQNTAGENDSPDQKKTDSAQEEEVKKIKQSLEEEIASSQSVLQSSWHLPDAVVYHITKVDSVYKDSIHKDSVKLILGNGGGFVILHKMVDTERMKRQFRKHDFSKLKDGARIEIQKLRYKLGYVFVAGRLWGYLLTVLALSLGAPFWFDLLNKLVKLRTGKQVAGDSSGATAGNSTAINKDILNRVG